MADDDDEDDLRDDAPFGPPAVPVEVHCLHCGAVFPSDRIELRPDGPDGDLAWCCPTPGCDALGFGFDLLPIDPNYRDERGGWISDDPNGSFVGHVDPAILDALDETSDFTFRPPPDAATRERRRRHNERMFGPPPEDEIPF